MAYTGDPILYGLLTATFIWFMAALSFVPSAVIPFKSEMSNDRIDSIISMWKHGAIGLFVWAIVRLVENITFYSATWNIKTYFIIPWISIFVLSVALDFKIIRGVGPRVADFRARKINDPEEMMKGSRLTVWEKLNTYGVRHLKMSVIAASLAFPGIWLFSQRYSPESTIQQEAAYVSILVTSILIAVSVMISAGFLASGRERGIMEWLEENTDMAAGDVLTTADLKVLHENMLKQTKGVNFAGSILDITEFTRDVAKAIGINEFYGATGLGNGRRVVMYNGNLYRLNADADVAYLDNLVASVYNGVGFSRGDMATVVDRGYVIDELDITSGYYVKTSGIGKEGYYGYLPWVYVTPSVVAAYTISRLAQNMIFFQSQYTGILAWFIESFVPIMGGLHFGMGHWYAFYAHTQIWFFIVGMLQPLFLYNTDQNQVWNQPNFYDNAWNETANYPERDIILGNSELISGVGAGVTAFAALWPVARLMQAIVVNPLYARWKSKSN